jgi:hypothetical protein
MPILENDIIFAYLNEYDDNHLIAERIFKNLKMERSRWRFQVLA